MVVNIVGLIVEEFNGYATLTDAGFETSMSVPADRKSGDRLITIERVGGSQSDVRDFPIISIQVWAESAWIASEWAQIAADFLRSLSLTHPRVARVDISSLYNNPDPSSEHPRSQINAQLVTKQ